MKRILIATDFSSTARAAARYGVQLAKALGADVILFSAYQVPHPFAALNVLVSSLAVMEDTRAKLADEARELGKPDEVRIEILCEEGIPHETILAIAKEKEVDLVIVGMAGSHSGLKKLFGDTATALVSDLAVPVIIVPADAKFKALKNVLYASDVFLDTTIAAIDQVKWLTDFFRSKLYVVRVVKDSYEEVRERVNTPQNLRKELKDLQAGFSFPVNTNTTQGLDDFIKERPVDVVVMLPHKHEWLERLLIRSETNEMVEHTHLPILLLPEASTVGKNMTPVEVAEKYGYDE
ncbi:MAG: universal stress protein [Flaviaesturariibacter sp.]|nr:universal stress protein [Flaviaesturariibacter sp.]